ncbi:DUF4232 domain-containing protein [Prauserella muralis]|uniref:Uncharacterized protein n=1 Tax=Prauserella muralis TaxID=588067 RepID=A0A2V4B9T8_9PSEU|nr:DUF4232 domain-containing protein [Prauserella muralis]PXY31821.1 hypothetical protein BAY60_05655 [Prauserella muralis]TWE13771.1 uncharacterized protein DUF4232 [Prauserella muralis]
MTIMRVSGSYWATAAVGAALTLALAGCGQGTENAAQTAGDSGSSTTSETTQSSSPAPSSPAATSPAPSGDAGGATAKQQAPGQGSAECTTGHLKLSLGQGSGAAGTYYAPLRFTNISKEPCVIRGYPGVSYVAGDDGHQVGPAAYREGTKGAAVTLAPGQVAHATVGFVQVHNYDPAACKPTPVRGLRVYPPHETDSMFVRLSTARDGCASNDIPGHQLTVQTVAPGPGGRG